MSTPEDDIQAALDALTDDRQVDWDALASRSPAAGDDTLRKLRVLAEIARAHQAATPATTTSQPEVPFTWCGLDVVAHLAGGSSGQVYRAHDRRLDRIVALKLIPVLDEDPRTELEAVREGRLLAKVRHPNVVTVFGADQALGFAGVWMELIEGRTLETELASRPPLDPREAIDIGVQVCSALQAVHSAGVVHGDIKASNVMRAGDGRLVLMDFGAGGERGTLETATLAGTPLYLAPELLAGGRATPASDIYAVGVLLFRALTGTFPVTGHSVAHLRETHVTGRPVPLRSLRRDVPRALADAVERGVAPDPAARHHDAATFGRALSGLVPGRTRQTHIPRSALVGALSMAVVLALLPLWRPAASPSPAPRTGPALRQIEVPEHFLIGRTSRDGSWLSYVDRRGGLALLALAHGTTMPVLASPATTDGDDARMFIASCPSPDGARVVYVEMVGSTPHLSIVEREDRRARTLALPDDVEGVEPFEWSADGRTVLVGLTRRGGGTSLVVVNAADGRWHGAREIGRLLPEFASLSPDGRRIAYDAPQAPATRNHDIFVGDLAGGAPIRVAGHAANDVAPQWSPDGAQVIFLSDRSGAIDLWGAVADGDDRSGPRLLMRDLPRMRVLGLTDTGAIYHQRLTGAVEVYVASFDAPTARPFPDVFAGANLSSRWSPDGRFVAYVSRRGMPAPRGDAERVLVRNVATGHQREFAPPLRGAMISSWSADGRRLLVHAFDEDSRLGLHALDLASGDTTPVVLRVDLMPDAPTVGRGEWMHDGRVLYLDPARQALVVRDVRAGTDAVLVDLRAGGATGLTGGPVGRGFRPSPDGRFVAYSVGMVDALGRSTALRVLSLDTRATRELIRVRDPESLVFQDWTPDGTALLFTRRLMRPSGAPRLWRIDTATGDARETTISMPAMRDVSVDRTGRRLTFTAGAATLDLWVLEGFLR